MDHLLPSTYRDFNFPHSNVIETRQDDVSEFLQRFEDQTRTYAPQLKLTLLEQQCTGDWPISVIAMAKRKD